MSAAPVPYLIVMYLCSGYVAQVKNERKIQLRSCNRNRVQYLAEKLPMAWVERAMRLPGKAWHVATALWWMTTVQRKRTVTMSLRRLERWGVTPRAGARALDMLERAGLVAVKRRFRKAAEVTWLEIQQADTTTVDAAAAAEASGPAE